ncbi:heterokaryon incompatibility protein-domain-containing protein [Xylariales sp. AK1849]|nr:heterokaryon incompatibility protein-domain-containing protein [Xylariales sp. AK1849]
MVDKDAFLRPGKFVRPQQLRNRSPALDDNSPTLYSRRLDSHDYEIRLIELYQPHSRSSDTPFKCNLIRSNLGASPRYSVNEFAALSYCWGDPAREQPLFVDRHRIMITRNLYAALHQLWRLGVHKIWVDAICINQSDKVEKSAQVAMMDRIYSRATAVYAWLGPGDADSDLAMTVLGSERLSAELDLPEELETAHDAVVRMFSRPYFSRTWIIQEISLPQQVYFLCGQKKVPVGTLLNKLDSLGDTAPAQYARHLFRPIRGYRALEGEKSLGKQSGDMVEWLIRTRKSQAGDLRDKLYALVGLATDGRKIIVAPNYEQSLLQACCDATAQIITVGHRTDVLLLVHRTDERDGWPSWVPNWSKIRTEPPPWVADCLSAERRRLLTPHRIDRRMLLVNGTSIDKIVVVMKSTLPRDELDRDQPLERSRDVVDGLRECFRLHDDPCDSMHIVEVMLMAYQKREEHSSLLIRWMRAHAEQMVGTRSILEHLNRYHGGRSDLSRKSDTLDRVTSKINETLALMSQWKMVIAFGERYKFQLVYRDTSPGDMIFKLDNCRLNVVLRPKSDDKCSLIGEVYPLNGRIEEPDGRRELICIE